MTVAPLEAPVPAPNPEAPYLRPNRLDSLQKLATGMDNYQRFLDAAGANSPKLGRFYHGQIESGRNGMISFLTSVEAGQPEPPLTREQIVRFTRLAGMEVEDGYDDSIVAQREYYGIFVWDRDGRLLLHRSVGEDRRYYYDDRGRLVKTTLTEIPLEIGQNPNPYHTEENIYDPDKPDNQYRYVVTSPNGVTYWHIDEKGIAHQDEVIPATVPATNSSATEPIV